MAEKIQHDKSESSIKEDVLDLKVRHFKVKYTNDTESKLITNAFGKENDKLKGKQIPFFYSEFLDMNDKIVNTVNNREIVNYFRTLKQDLKYAYDVFDILQKYEDFIDTLDRPADDDKKKLLPRYKKMKRLESFYEILIRFTLTVLHNFYWNDITLGVEGAGSKNISYRVKQILPLMMKVKEMFEDEINKEFPAHISEKEFFQSIRRN
jgi:SpoVK/Ycf46/Vps4 family AAA+-type ATPase